MTTDEREMLLKMPAVQELLFEERERCRLVVLAVHPAKEDRGWVESADSCLWRAAQAILALR